LALRHIPAAVGRGVPLPTGLIRGSPWMPEEKHADLRPLWVRIVVGARASRRGTIIQVLMLAFLACTGFTICAIESGRNARLGHISCVIGLVGMGISLVLMAWAWLAVRWIDRHGAWA
jgi:hypothetical protein